jgi:hypothetical protein
MASVGHESGHQAVGCSWRNRFREDVSTIVSSWDINHPNNVLGSQVPRQMVLESDVSCFPRCTTSGDVLDGALVVTENNGCAGRRITLICDQLTEEKDFLADGRDNNVFSFTS